MKIAHANDIQAAVTERDTALQQYYGQYIQGVQSHYTAEMEQLRKQHEAALAAEVFVHEKNHEWKGL